MSPVMIVGEDNVRPEEASAPSRANANRQHEDAGRTDPPRARPEFRRRGPKTAAGKARVSLNAVTHAMSSTRRVVPGESPTEWATYRTAIIEALAPAGPVETALAERVAAAFWRLRRVTAYEEAAIAERQDLETASARWLPHPLDVDKIIRFEAHLSRQLYQALHEVESMQAARRGQRTPLLRVDVHHEPGALAAPAASTV